MGLHLGVYKMLLQFYHLLCIRNLLQILFERGVIFLEKQDRRHETSQCQILAQYRVHRRLSVRSYFLALLSMQFTLAPKS